MFDDDQKQMQGNTELHYGEELLVAILNTVPFEIVVRDMNGKILFANEAHAASYQATVEEVIGKSDAEYWEAFGRSREEIDAWLAEDKEVIKTGAVLEYVQEIKRSSGESAYFHNIKKLLRLEDGSPCILALYNDITEQRRTEDELRHTQATASELAGIHKATVTYAHEINNPLTGILANVQMMLENHELGNVEYSDELVAMLKDISMAALRVRDVIRKMEALRDAKTKPYLNRPELIDLSDDE